MARNYDKTYLDGLIAKAKKSWEGVDVESYMSDLRDDTFDKEVAENLSKEVASYITEQIKSNMDKATIKCRDLMYGDWCCSGHGLPMQITNVGNDYAYATWEGNEGDPWEFDDKDDQPQPIPLTPEILEKNGFVFDCDFWTIANPRYNNVRMVRYCSIDEDATDAFLGHWAFDENYAIDYIHELQHALRLCGLNELADNFKV